MKMNEMNENEWKTIPRDYDYISTLPKKKKKVVGGQFESG